MPRTESSLPSAASAAAGSPRESIARAALAYARTRKPLSPVQFHQHSHLFQDFRDLPVVHISSVIRIQAANHFPTRRSTSIPKMSTAKLATESTKDTEWTGAKRTIEVVHRDDITVFVQRPGLSW